MFVIGAITTGMGIFYALGFLVLLANFITYYTKKKSVTAEEKLHKALNKEKSS